MLGTNVHTGAFGRALDRQLAAFVGKGFPGAVALAADRRGLLYRGAAGVRVLGGAAPLDADSVLTLFSCTKPITTVAALQLWENGQLDLDIPAAEYAPELRTLQVLEGFDSAGEPLLRAPRREITTRMLLLHTAGMSYDFLNADYAALKARLGAGGRPWTQGRTDAAAGLRSRREVGIQPFD